MVIALMAGAAMYWLQEYAFYAPVSFVPGQEVQLTTIANGQPEPILAENVQGVDADSSPLRYRACFTTPLTQAMLTETYRAYPGAVPLNGPEWFDCFDAAQIGAALERGEALAFEGNTNQPYGIDRVVAIFPDGRGFVWTQMNDCGKTVFDGKDAPPNCPPAPAKE